MHRRLGSIQRKFLILLLGQLSLGFSYTPGQRSKVLRQMNKEWHLVNEGSLRRAIRNLYKNKLIDIKESLDGKTKIVLEDSGKEKALEYKLDEIALKKPRHWDKKWRLILFDIPHSKSRVREIFRLHLKRIGFFQYQKSVFIHPYPCKDEIDFIVEFYKIRPYVRQLIVEEMDNNLHIQQLFKKILD